jgi:Protein of unknown function (DUF3035)
MKVTASVAMVFGCAMLLAGCGGDGGASRFFGLSRDAPDEFTVTTQPPLSIPPDLNLRPPQPGAPRPQTVSERAAAEAALAPQTALGSAQAGMSPGQAALLQAAGPPAPGDIRRQIAADNRQAAQPSFVDELMFWQSNSPPAGVAVDPAKEQERIRANQALGRPVDSGATPIIQRNKSLFDTLF